VAFQITIEPARRRIHVRGQGASSLPEVEAAARRVAALPGHDPGFALLIDVRELDYIMSYREALGLRELMIQLKPAFGGPIAIVSRPGVQYGATRVVASLNDLIGLRVGVFLEPAAAERWLDDEAARTA
jgi:hypothetical protein